MNRQPRWITAAIVLVSLVMVVVAVMLLFAVVRLGVPTELLGELTEAAALAAGHRTPA